MRISLELGKPSAEILRVEALSPWRRSMFLFSLLANWCLEVVSWFARVLAPSRVSTSSALPQLQLTNCKF